MVRFWRFSFSFCPVSVCGRVNFTIGKFIRECSHMQGSCAAVTDPFSIGVPRSPAEGRPGPHSLSLGVGGIGTSPVAVPLQAPPRFQLHRLSVLLALLPQVWSPSVSFLSKVWKGCLLPAKAALSCPHPHYTLPGAGVQAPCCLRGQEPLVILRRKTYLEYGDRLARWTFIVF